MKDIPSIYNPRQWEKDIYSGWEKKGFFHAKPESSKEPFSIVIPPPNVTGILHMGHALNNTLQDILIRWRTMQGRCCLWMPGTDHAGIATQNVVEKKLANEGKNRKDLGREEFLKEVWKWREEYGSTIIRQLKRLGSSCDWKRSRFTMDERYSIAVVEVFVSLWNKGLLYQGDYIINWCPRCQTALSDEEAPHQQKEGFLYYIKYPVKDSDEFVTVATTRPETMLGDTAVAVNPNDRRYNLLWEKRLILPLGEREIGLIKDGFVDPKFGTGAVKVTPAHDPNDFEMGNRHNLSRILVMNPDGTMNKNAGIFKGMDRFEAREAVVESLKARGLIAKISPHSHTIGHCYRCNTIIEPYLSRQWFVRMKKLAAPAIEAVKKGKIKFYPKRWTKVYLRWMENIRDWCISRQIWWGHRIPVYYCKDCRKAKNKKLKIEQGLVVSRIKPERCPDCGGTDLVQDEDVLDTWFSSWLWPFVIFGWPKKTKELGYFYPTSVLVTAPEILFFWVARMIMAGIEFMGNIPFKDVYIHGTVRDLTGKKMSKSLGNIIDPIDIIDEFGADALRYSMIALTATGQDVYLSKEKFALGRNFANKIWNASRFVIRTIKDSKSQTVKQSETKDLSLADRWILSRLNRTIKRVDNSLENYRFNEAEGIVYDFFWHDFCDWYVELIKVQGARCKMQGAKLIYVLETSLKLLHPFMPFVTEAVWQNIKKRKSIMIQKWPESDNRYINKNTEREMDAVKEIIVSIRNIRSNIDIPYSKGLKVCLVPLKEKGAPRLKQGIDYIKHLARLEELKIDRHIRKPGHSVSAILEDFNVFIPLEGIIDIGSEKKRLVKKMQELNRHLKFTRGKLKDKNFIRKAPQDIVNKEKEKSRNLKEQLKRIKETLDDL